MNLALYFYFRRGDESGSGERVWVGHFGPLLDADAPGGGLVLCTDPLARPQEPPWRMHPFTAAQHAPKVSFAALSPSFAVHRVEQEKPNFKPFFRI